MSQSQKHDFQALLALQAHLNRRIIGQTELIRSLLIALLCDGHLLVEGAPGLAKTTAIKELSHCIQGDFHRIQFTPDLLPADLTGTDIFHAQDSSFHFQEGPLFHNMILADEINRAPAKVQSALLEAMAERQITVGHHSYPLARLFLVMATQNPIEQEGTYPLPEAQLDRFLLYVKIGYPTLGTELDILRLHREQLLNPTQVQSPPPSLSQDLIFSAREALLHVHLSKELEEYLVQLIMATRDASPYGMDLANWIRYGASPRGTLGLDRAARAHAWLEGKDYVSPENIHSVFYSVLRHRVLLSFEAEAEGVTTDDVLKEILHRVAIP